jgi:tetratricopeptide (TPR) repeat protein
MRNIFFRGGLKMLTRDYVGAEADFNRMIGFDQEYDWSARYGRGWARLQLGWPELALADFNNQIAALPKLHAETVASSNNFMKTFPLPEQKEWRAKLEAGFGRMASVSYSSRATAYRALGQYDKSLADYNTALKLTHTDPSLYSGRARTEFAMGNLSAAFEDFWIRTQLVLHLQMSREYFLHDLLL